MHSTANLIQLLNGMNYQTDPIFNQARDIFDTEKTLRKKEEKRAEFWLRFSSKDQKDLIDEKRTEIIRDIGVEIDSY